MRPCYCEDEDVEQQRHGALDHRSGSLEQADRAGAVSGYRRQRRPNVTALLSTLCHTYPACGVLLLHLNMFLKPWATPLALWLISTVDAKARSSNTSYYDASSYQLSARLSVLSWHSLY